MSRLSTRTVFAVLISLGVVFAIFTSVQGASLDLNAGERGSHLVGGAMVNFNHDRLTDAELETYNAQLESYNNPHKNGAGGGCHSVGSPHPDEY
ncbi:MAG TPA: hypothetical protein VK851_05290 [Anaerolineales bacterium]|nr:hypothetical protein [Anaerolineales bacterium]